MSPAFGISTLGLGEAEAMERGRSGHGLQHARQLQRHLGKPRLHASEERLVGQICAECGKERPNHRLACSKCLHRVRLEIWFGTIRRHVLTGTKRLSWVT